MTIPRLKICGLTRRADSEAAAAAGAAFLGAIFAAESPRRVTPAAAAELFDGLRVERVGVFVNASADEVVRAARCAELDVLQLHGEEPPALVAELRAAGRWAIWKAVRVRDGRDLEHALDVYASEIDGILLDAWRPDARGGTGHAFSWPDLAAARARIPAPLLVVVAGGLRADNLAQAVALLRPDAVDISSGVESAPGVKDRAALHAVVQALRASS